MDSFSIGFVNSARAVKDLFEREGVLYMGRPVIVIVIVIVMRDEQASSFFFFHF